jgi:hypothetical protein
MRRQVREPACVHHTERTQGVKNRHHNNNNNKKKKNNNNNNALVKKRFIGRKELNPCQKLHERKSLKNKLETQWQKGRKSERAIERA